ncbi:SUMF1/EgtB/PvdO family nonheme iron enzyme [Aromatoleum toluvorans]|uniref:SUMF1/EgtB/PvdO family nonheme iron enzyme n=1 Tax=Aromatoleum toluvorans TaxID=92002 RepID=A0ABX1Q029_9RHOO|nr:formylglycine-generating enzyme family protein [Aromatoleum toluvorans]NMG44983.1 SUMF1/EgtB/PvdO family nonheme iron enzyme [Aromatoleum toluvorans]
MKPTRPTLAVLFLAGSLIAAGVHAAKDNPPHLWQDPQVGLEFVRVDKACYRMGNDTAIPPEPDGGWVRLNYTQSLSADEGPVHEVCVDAYWLGRHEVTRKQWKQVMGSLPEGSNAALPDNTPVTRVTWEQARAFADRMTVLHKKRYRFRLPTEAEWEFACRGAKAGALDKEIAAAADELGRLAVAAIEAPVPPEPVGSRPANGAGFFDLLGNVWEWTADDYAADGYRRHALYNPRHSAGTDKAVIRGGSARTEFVQTRCTMRGRYPKHDTLDLLGLRLVREE